MSESLALGRLALQEKSLGESALAADFEGAKIFVPGTLGYLGLRLDPKAELIKVGDGDIAVAHAVDQMLTDVRGQFSPAGNLWHQSPASAAKYHATQFISEALGFLRIGGVAKTLGEIEEFLLFAFFSLDAVLDQFDEHAIGAKPACLSQIADLCGGSGGQRDALADGFFLGLHRVMIHHFAPECTMSVTQGSLSQG